MQNHNLNLTRKWRSRQFDQVVGQDLSVKILKNSLYKGYLFPVYLFNGQHGCGKTSVARIFAASINCQLLSTFQKDPQSTKIPCLECVSCKAMSENNHPDFFEIDAASHTGVDNIRTIIDSSSLLPLMGKTKIYLIDEAHMLSKAAFNAFLKILEEPPASVVFILATTDADKIIDTVKSRCFQLFFKSVESAQLLKHLSYICQQESIKYEEQALAVIVKESHGSVRDALNCLEHVRFSSSVISQDAVYAVLGYVSDLILLGIVSHIMHGSPARLLSFLQEHELHTFSMNFVWYRQLHVLRALLWAKHGVSLRASEEYHKELHHLARNCSWKLLTNLIEMFYAHELLFQKTTAQYELFEMILLRMFENQHEGDGTPLMVEDVQSDVKKNSDEVKFVAPIEKVAKQSSQPQEFLSDISVTHEDNHRALWNSFVKSLFEGQPLLHSIFKQGEFSAFDEKSCVVSTIFLHKHLFFKDMIIDSEMIWLPLLQHYFSSQARLAFYFKDGAQDVDNSVELVSQKKNEINVLENQIFDAQAVVSESAFDNKVDQVKKSSSERVGGGRADQLVNIDISDKDKWKKTHVLLKYFSGTVSEMRKNIYE